MSRPRHGVAVHPATTSGTRSPPRAGRRLAALPRGRRDRRRRALRDPLLQGVPARRRLARGAADQLDGRPRLPAVPARRPVCRVRDDVLRLPRAPLHRRAAATRLRTTSSSSGRSTPTPGSGATMPALYERSRVDAGDARRAAAAGRRDRAAHRRGGRGDGPPRRARRSSRPRTTRRSRRSARARSGERTALVSLGTYIAAMVHGRENHKRPTHFWTNFASSRTATSTRATASAAGCGR